MDDKHLEHLKNIEKLFLKKKIIEMTDLSKDYLQYN
jgi:hypothetical protein